MLGCDDFSISPAIPVPVLDSQVRLELSWPASVSPLDLVRISPMMGLTARSPWRGEGVV